MITVCSDEAVLEVEDIGVTLRTLLGFAAEGFKHNPKRVWKVRYKDTIIGSVRLRTEVPKGKLSSHLVLR